MFRKTEINQTCGIISYMRNMQFYCIQISIFIPNMIYLQFFFRHQFVAVEDAKTLVQPFSLFVILNVCGLDVGSYIILATYFDGCLHVSSRT